LIIFENTNTKLNNKIFNFLDIILKCTFLGHHYPKNRDDRVGAKSEKSHNVWDGYQKANKKEETSREKILIAFIWFKREKSCKVEGNCEKKTFKRPEHSFITLFSIERKIHLLFNFLSNLNTLMLLIRVWKQKNSIDDTLKRFAEGR
jgi:hypothetical protein